MTISRQHVYKLKLAGIDHHVVTRNELQKEPTLGITSPGVFWLIMKS